MKISHKLILVILINLIAIIGLGIVSYYGVKNINDRFDELINVPIPSIIRLGNMTDAFILSVDEAHSYRLYGKAEEKEDYYANNKEFDRLMEGIKKDVGYGSPDVFKEEDTVLIDRISEKVTNLRKIIETDFYEYEHAKETGKTEIDPYSEIKDEIVRLLRQYRGMEEEEIKFAHEEVDKITTRTLWIIPLSLLIILIINFVINWFLARSIIKPLHSLQETASELGKGDLNKRVNLSSKDEFGILANTFNIMADNVQRTQSSLEVKIKERTAELENAKSGLEKTVAERTAELEKAKSGLEKTVAERTTDLQNKLVEVEKMNKLMTDREIKMIELKKEIEELKNKLNRA